MRRLTPRSWLASAEFQSDATVIIESTVSPPYLDAVLEACPRLQLAVAPRRDWFDSPEKHLGALPRIVGADAMDLLTEVSDYISLVCREVIPVLGLRLAALVKITENAIRQVELAFCNELAATLGDDYDVRQLLELCATKWNIGLYRPSIGVGGYCIPLAPQYLKLLDRPLAMSQAAMDASALHIARVVAFLERFPSVHFWGLGYKATAPFTPSSPAVWIAEKLLTRDVRVGVFCRSAAEKAWAEKHGTQMLHWDSVDFRGAALVIPVAHADVRALNDATASKTVGCYSNVIDNENALQHISAEIWRSLGTTVRVPGRKGWLVP